MCFSVTKWRSSTENAIQIDLIHPAYTRFEAGLRQDQQLTHPSVAQELSVGMPTNYRRNSLDNMKDQVQRTVHMRRMPGKGGILSFDLRRGCEPRRDRLHLMYQLLAFQESTIQSSILPWRYVTFVSLSE